MADQQNIAFAWGDAMVGYELDCLIDAEVEPGVWSGRTYADAPEIDGTVFVEGAGVEVGQLVAVEITGRDEYDLLAEASN
jgi:ribosomal protein S12 methylthiotransferase